jgi:hypothetical protein
MKINSDLVGALASLAHNCFCRSTFDMMRV